MGRDSLSGRVALADAENHADIVRMVWIRGVEQQVLCRGHGSMQLRL